MNRRLFISMVLLATVLINVYPLFQYCGADGHVYYQNGFDEPGYLSFDMAAEYAKGSRKLQAGTFLVVMLHRAGLSGGQINMLLDLVSFLGILICLRYLFSGLGYNRKQARAMSLLVTLLPMLPLTPNLQTSTWFNDYLASDWVKWLVVWNGTNFLPLSRSPEPQVSYLLLAAAGLVSVRAKSLIPAMAVLPFLYPFLAIPAGFVLLSLFIRKGLDRFEIKGISMLAPMAAFLLIGTALHMYFRLLVPDNVKGAMAHSHLPLISIAGTLGLLFCLCHGLSFIKREHVYPCVLIAIAPLVAVNHQLISGWIAQPYNFEVYYGISALALIAALSLHMHSKLAMVVIGVSLLAIVYAHWNPYGAFQFRFNYQTNRPMNAAVYTALKEDPARVAIASANLASVAGLIFPKEKLTALAFQNTINFPGVQERFEEYQCLKKCIRTKSSHAAIFEPAFDLNDKGYKTYGYDYVLNHQGRKKIFHHYNDPRLDAGGCAGGDYLLVYNDGSIERVGCGRP